MPNVQTSETAILNQVVTELLTLSNATALNVFLAAQVIWLSEPPGDFYLEVVPGVAQDNWAKQAGGWVKDSFTVAIFKRVLMDPNDSDAAKIADASVGLLALVASVQTKLIESFLAGLALVPILPERREAGERNPEDPYDGWVMMRRTFKVEYLYAFPGIHSTS